MGALKFFFQKIWDPISTREVEISKIEAWRQEPLHMLVHSSPLYTRAFNLRAWTLCRAYNNLDGTLMISCGTTTTSSRSMFTSPWTKLEHQEIELSFCGPQANEFSSILWLVMNAPLYSIIAPLISHSEQAQFINVLTIASFKFGEGLENLNFRWRFVNSKYQTRKNCKYELSTQAPV